MANRFEVSGKGVIDICNTVVPDFFEAFLRCRARERSLDINVIEVRRPRNKWPQELIDQLVDQLDPIEKQRIKEFERKWNMCVVDSFLEYMDKHR